MKYLLILSCTLEILDGITTHWAVTKGLIREWNPLVSYIAGDWYFILLKAFGSLFCALILYKIYKRFPKIGIISVNSIVMFYGIVFLWNSYALFRP
jgi:hypothetical protein